MEPNLDSSAAKVKHNISTSSARSMVDSWDRLLWIIRNITLLTAFQFISLFYALLRVKVLSRALMVINSMRWGCRSPTPTLLSKQDFFYFPHHMGNSTSRTDICSSSKSTTAWKSQWYSRLGFEFLVFIPGLFQNARVLYAGQIQGVRLGYFTMSDSKQMMNYPKFSRFST